MFKKYDKYTESGIEGIGKIPESWIEIRVTDLFSFNKGLSITKENLQEKGVPCISYGEIHSKYSFEVNPRKDKLMCVSEDYLVSNKQSLLQYGDFIFADTSEDIEGVGNFTYLNSDFRIFAGYHTIIAKPKKVINYRYYAYLFDSIGYRSQMQSSVNGIKVYSITKRILKSASLLLPDTDTQLKISDYLDRSIKEIDGSIDLLQQKKKSYLELKWSLIYNTVTKGLNKNVELKDSNINWIGNIPKHWHVKRIKDIYSITKFKVGEKSRDYSLLSLTQNGVIERDIDSGIGKFPAEFDTYQRIDKGDLIFCLFDVDVTPRTIGYSHFDGMITGAYTVIKGKVSEVVNKYYYYLFLFADNQKRLSFAYTGLRNTIKKDKFLGFNIPAPSIEEQNDIVEYIDEKTNKIDEIVRIIDQNISSLKEYRKVLINDVVTGKIKVT